MTNRQSYLSRVAHVTQWMLQTSHANRMLEHLSDWIRKGTVTVTFRTDFDSLNISVFLLTLINSLLVVSDLTVCTSWHVLVSYQSAAPTFTCISCDYFCSTRWLCKFFISWCHRRLAIIPNFLAKKVSSCICHAVQWLPWSRNSTDFFSAEKIIKLWRTLPADIWWWTVPRK